MTWPVEECDPMHKIVMLALSDSLRMRITIAVSSNVESTKMCNDTIAPGDCQGEN